MNGAEAERAMRKCVLEKRLEDGFTASPAEFRRQCDAMLAFLLGIPVSEISNLKLVADRAAALMRSDKNYIVGEQGPEIFIPDPGGVQ